METSRIPSTAAAARNSASRTRPTSTGSTPFPSEPNLPRSPRVAVTRYVSTPSAAYLASVPPKPSDSSSGCARTASNFNLLLIVIPNAIRFWNLRQDGHLGVPLESLRLESEIAGVQPTRQTGDNGAENAREIKRERDPAAAASAFDIVPRVYQQPRGGSNPREPAALLNVRDLPARRKKLRLTDNGSASNHKRAGIEASDAADRRGPFRPVL